jgi:hypothetical protein
LAYVSTIENPNRFRRSRLVGAHLGLTPRHYQSGDVDRSGHISKCGDTLARLCLYEAATVIMTRVEAALQDGDCRFDLFSVAHQPRMPSNVLSQVTREQKSPDRSRWALRHH